MRTISVRIEFDSLVEDSCNFKHERKSESIFFE